MGNTQSASPARQDAVLCEPETNGGRTAATPNAPDATSILETSAEKEESGVSRRTVERRRSLMGFSSFPSLRKRRSVVGVGDDVQEGSVHSSPSRRRWRAFSGLKNRPVSTLTDSNVPVMDEEPSEEPLHASASEHAVTEKGKERETSVTEQDSTEPQEVEPEAREPAQNLPGPSQPNVEFRDADENLLSPHTMLRELRELQDTLSMSNVAQSSSARSGDQIERPPTPIPTSVAESNHSLEAERDGRGALSNSALAESLGSWMSGRSRTETAEPTSNDAFVSPTSHSQGTGSSAPLRTPGEEGNNFNGTDLFRAARRNSRRATGSMSPLPVPPARSAGNSRFGQNPAQEPTQQEQRTLPPTGTGTLVVVQGVVHTTDVRHSHSHSPRRSQTPSASTRAPRSTSSTPTLRPTTGDSTPRSSTRPSTPQQPPPRRGRFSSLTSSLRPRSRPETATSRLSAGAAGWGHNLTMPSDSHNASDGTTSDPNGGPGLSVDSSASESESVSASTSTSAGPSATPPDTAPQIDSQSEVISAIDELPLPTPPPTPSEGGESRLPNGQTPMPAGSVDGDASEDEAELSASSIEVLGTLLSVATAATAASLVTGTTDPLFSSGLAGPGANGASANTTRPSQNNSSVVPPHALNMGSSSREPGADSGSAEAAVNTRMRAAWDSLRDRFSRSRGRRGAGPGGPDDGREDPREQMLREMARAFNTGLGLDPDDGSDRWMPGRHQGSEGIPGRREEGERATGGSPAAPDPSRSPADADMPDGGRIPSVGPGPEGSFERFLHNLQVDLRTALTEDYAARRARANARGARSANSPSSDGSAPTPTANTDASPSVSSAPSDSDRMRDNQIPSPSGQADVDTAPSDVPPPMPSPPTPNTPRPATLDLPTLPGDTEASLGGTGAGRTPPQAHGITGQPGAGINWWRLYRFPPMQLAPQPSTLAADGVPAAPPRSTSEPPATPQASQSQPRTLPANPEAAANQNVVPVIVVGLQSVPVNRGGAHNHHHHHHHHDDPTSPLDAHSLGGDPLSEPSTRERAWPLRAASRAFGRRGRRVDGDSPADDGAVPSAERGDSAAGQREGRHGGRTYLIFVIGGYYPPNHSIVTGADDMNSFEALWELAELLGQVKPPVASKEDIEKSGLEIIKASSLKDYEQAGKIASNTVERCLICLDDYECEDDLRLLSCRHVFHKQCVDKWLEQGRNNCPACRTKGVETGDESPPPSD